jgi:hypothetical protein
MTNDDKIAALEAEVEALKKAVNPEPIDWDRVVREHKSQMHAAAEARASRFYQPSREEVDAYERAGGGGGAAHHGGVRSPSGMIPSSPSTAASAPAEAPRGTGWRREIPISPPPGVNYADRLMDAQDAKDRHELIMQEARRLAAQKLANK